MVVEEEDVEVTVEVVEEGEEEGHLVGVVGVEGEGAKRETGMTVLESK